MRQSDPQYNYRMPFLRVDYDCADLASALNGAQIPVAREDASDYIKIQIQDDVF